MTLLDRARRLAGDRRSGAAELLAALLPLLDDARGEGPGVTAEVARLVCRGQMAMAALWNACAAAVGDKERFASVRAEMDRAPRALARAAGSVLRDVLIGDPRPPLVLTLSYSGSVAQALGEVAGGNRVRILCAEGRPGLEGRRLAAELAAAGGEVTVVTDAGLTAGLREATAVVVGADALYRDRWLNKVGTLGLAAAAMVGGIPVYVVASRDKAVAPALEPFLQPTSGPVDEVWAEAPAGIQVANPYFESTPAALATLFLTEAGPVSPVDLPQLVSRYNPDIATLLELLG